MLQSLFVVGLWSRPLMTSHAVRSLPPCQLLSNDDEPVLNDRQAQIMKLQGYKWDAKRKRWFRGAPSSIDRRAAECRSSTRVARFVDSTGQPAACGEVVREAVRHMESVLQEARRAELKPDEETDLRLKDWISSWWAPVLWLIVQISIGVTLLQGCGVAWSPGTLAQQEWSESVLQASLLGVVCTPPLALAQRQLSSIYSKLGVESNHGRLERMLCDAILGKPCSACCIVHTST